MKNVLRRVLLLWVGLLLAAIGFSQTKPITGRVTDDKGNPVPNASVLVKGSTQGTSTDENGNFSLEVPASATTLTISSLNFTEQDVRITGSVLSIALVPQSGQMDEVVVVGYGTQKVTKISGAIATVKEKEIEKLRPVRAEDAIQGRASGVTVISPGTPGAKPTVLIRGIPSYTGTDPVVIVDGSIQTLDDLNSIPPADIESINVLKDAATTSIYGVKGGNGVILVTTKSGRRNQKTEFSYNGNYGVQEVFSKIGVLNATEYGAIVNEGSVASGGDLIFPDLSILGKGTDWQDQIFKNAPIQSHALTARGGSEKMTYFLSGSFLNQDGIVGGGDKSFFRRMNATSNITYKLSSKLKFTAKTSFLNIRGSGVPENSINGVISNSLNFDPTTPIYNTNPNVYGKYATSPNILSEIFNPLTQLADTYNKSNTN